MCHRHFFFSTCKLGPSVFAASFHTLIVMAYSRPSLSARAELSAPSQQFLKALLAQSTSALPFILLAHHCCSQGRQSRSKSIFKIVVPPTQQKKQKKHLTICNLIFITQYKTLFHCSVLAYTFLYAENKIGCNILHYNAISGHPQEIIFTVSY